MLTQAIVDVNENPALFRWCYYMRATGAHAQRRLAGHAVAQRVRADRAAQPVKPFDVIEAGRAPRACMASDHKYPSSQQTAETYNVYYDTRLCWTPAGSQRGRR